MGVPPQILNLDNVEISDDTANGDFKDINVPGIFANAKALFHAPPPLGERLFIATIRDSSENFTGTYDIGLSTADPIVHEEFENFGQYDVDYEDFVDILAQDVNKIIMGWLSKQELEYQDKKVVKPDISNTKLVNLSNNPEFTLNRLFATVNQLQVTRARPSLHLMRKAPASRIQVPTAKIQQSIEVPRMVKEETASLPLAKKAKQTETEKEERLRA
jgi:hypothetical protein